MRSIQERIKTLQCKKLQQGNSHSANTTLQGQIVVLEQQMEALVSNCLSGLEKKQWNNGDAIGQHSNNSSSDDEQLSPVASPERDTRVETPPLASHSQPALNHPKMSLKFILN